MLFKKPATGTLSDAADLLKNIVIAIATANTIQGFSTAMDLQNTGIWTDQPSK